MGNGVYTGNGQDSEDWGRRMKALKSVNAAA